ncbi:DsbA family protein [Virgibacillus halodenitrificans]|uniref:DsbA family protein n=1 Tax=Virgibacillus halodenitrificans TaxID=1482 RepID=A0ABR7VS23_VIRHA|nr:DsbA family protein [Virgibacillus halodenitrificans]MBD1224151.1 DsbA family protein [Virgibacillus halodenitrificans]
MKGKNSPIKITVIITLVIIALIVAIVVLTNNGTGKDTTTGNQPSIEGQPVMGEEDAPVTIVEFGDFKCPACKAWGEQYFPQIKQDYIDTGKAKFAYINVLFHGEESKLGSLAAESVWAQNPEAYWDFHKQLFAQQPAEDHDTKWLTMDTITKIADNMEEIDGEQLKEDIENNTHLDAVNKDTELVTEHKVELTPSIMVNDKMIEDPFDYAAIQAAIEQELEGN